MIILLILKLSAYLYGVRLDDQYFDAVLIAIVSFYLVGESVQLYRSWRGVPTKQLVQPVLFTWLVTVAVLLVVGYITKTTGTFSRVTIGMWFVGVPIALIGWRILIRQLLGMVRAKGFNTRSVAIAGANRQGAKLGDLIQKTPSLGMRLRGYYEDRGSADDRVAKVLPAEVEGNFETLIQKARSGQVDLVYIALPLKGEERINELVRKLSDTTASVYVVPDFLVFNLLHSRWVNVGDIPTISIFETPFYGVEGWAKRLEDIILSVIILAFISIPMLLIAIGVKISSPGPVFFKQKRYGLDGRQIRVWKFRSMTVAEDGDVVTQATKGDLRCTRFGTYLRRTSLDELPQFINVLMGEMSIVGPRPHAVAHNEEYRELISGYMLRHKVKPGITGWAQINGWRGETDTLLKMEKRVEHDLWYIRSWSVMLDIKIIFLTMFRGFTNENAY